MNSCPRDIEAVNGGMPTDCEYEILEKEAAGEAQVAKIPSPVKALSTRPQRRIKIALSFDFDAVSHWLETGCHPDNNMAGYSSGIFADQVGAIRLLSMLKKFDIADKVTWFVPGHTMETFPETVQKVVKSGAEIGFHGYSHEGIYQMTVDQERDLANSNGYVSTRVVEEMWKDKFLWLWENSKGEEGSSTTDFAFPILMHPDTSGLAHIIGMSERIIKWLKSWGDSVEFHKHEGMSKNG